MLKKHILILTLGISFLLGCRMILNAQSGPVTKCTTIPGAGIGVVSVPVTVTGFNNIGGISLTLNYDPAILQFENVTLNPAISNSLTNGNSPGVFILSYTGYPGINLANNDTLLTLHFNYTGPPSGSTSLLTWVESPGDANEYSSPDGIPYEKEPFGNYFINGSVTVITAATGLWTGLTSSDWNLGSNWQNFTVPPASAMVVIPTAAPNWPHMNGNLTLGSLCAKLTMQGAANLYVDGDLTINTGSSLIFTGAGSLFLGGNWSNSGIFNHGTSTIVFTGSHNALILEGSLQETFWKIDFSKTNATVYIQGIVNVIGIDN